jgi:hypothetical protein
MRQRNRAGADWAYAITAGLRHARVLPAVAGLVAGHVVATVAVAAGVAAVMAGVPLLLTVLTATGAATTLDRACGRRWCRRSRCRSHEACHRGAGFRGEAGARLVWPASVPGLPERFQVARRAQHDQ